jgi:hypothetical protein
MGIILFQVAFQAAAWVFFAWTAAALLRRRILGDALFLLLLVYSLTRGIHEDGTRLLSESISLSLFLITAALALRCFRNPTRLRALCVLPAAALFAFARDVNAYLLLGTALIMASEALIRWFGAPAPRPRPSLPLAGLAAAFVALFAISAAGASAIAQPAGETCYGPEHPIVRHGLADKQGARHLFPLLNVFDLRILPYECRVDWFAERGLPVSAAVRAKAYQWACQGDWDWYWQETLQPARAWLERNGKREYFAFLCAHPRYAFLRPWVELKPIYLHGPAADSGFAVAALEPMGPPLDFAFGPAKPFLAAALIGAGAAFRRRTGTGGSGAPSAFAAALGLAFGMALFIYHADAMDLERHSRGNVVFLDATLALAAFTLADRAGARRDAPSAPGAR